MQMDKKQKTLLVVTMVAFGYLGYQVYGLVSQDVSNQPVATKTSASYQAKLARNNSSGPVQTAEAAPEKASMSYAIPQVENGLPEPGQQSSQPLVKEQKAYLNMVNQYELAKMQRRLLEERAAIAAAQHRIATLNKQTRGIDESMLEQQTADNNDASDPHSKMPYQLSYLDNQHGQWTATLSQDGHYHEVSVGMALPDGAKILKIDRQGVTLEAGDHNELITFNGIIPIKVQTTKAKEKPKLTPAAEAQKDAAIEPPEKNETTLSTDTIEKAAQKALLNAGLLPKKTGGTEMKVDPAVVKLSDRIEPGLVKSTEKAEQEITTKQADVLHAEVAVPVKKTVSHPAKEATEKRNTKADVKLRKQAAIKLVDTSEKDLAPANAKALLAKASPAIVSDKSDPKEVSSDPIKPKATMPAADAPLNTAARYTEDERRLLRLSSHHYTIQLIGSYHRDIVENFAIANDLGNQAMQFHVENRGRPWYMLLYGNYQTQAEAQNALQQLPPNLTPERPWIRRIAEVQRDVRNRTHHR